MTDPELIQHTQDETLFDVPGPQPPVRAGSRDYLADLAGLAYSDELRPLGTWSFWALAPIHREWRRHYVAVQGHAECVWLWDGQALYQALVNRANGLILRRRVWKP